MEIASKRIFTFKNRAARAAWEVVIARMMQQRRKLDRVLVSLSLSLSLLMASGDREPVTASTTTKHSPCFVSLNASLQVFSSGLLLLFYCQGEKQNKTKQNKIALARPKMSNGPDITVSGLPDMKHFEQQVKNSTSTVENQFL